MPYFYNPEKRQNGEGGFYDKSPFLVLSDLAGFLLFFRNDNRLLPLSPLSFFLLMVVRIPC